MLKTFYSSIFKVVIASLAMALMAFPMASSQAPVTLKPALPLSTSNTVDAPQMLKAERVRKDVGCAKRLAQYRWVDRMAMADPSIVAAICSYSASAKLLAKHPHIGNIAEADHYFCRRLTKWRGAARALVANPEAYKVIARDPEGIYRAIKYDRSIAKILSKNMHYEQMIVENPELGKVLARYM